MKLSNTLFKRPITSFVFSLIVLFVAIFLVSTLKAPAETTGSLSNPKKVAVFSVSDEPYFAAKAKVVEGNIVTVAAQTQGFINGIYFKEGSYVTAGSPILKIDTGAGGGQIAENQLNLAKKDLEFAESNYEKQKDIIRLRREVTEKGDDNTDLMAEIAASSLNSTNTLIADSKEILAALEGALDLAPAGEVLGIKQGILAQKSALSQLETAKRNLELQADGKPIPEISDRSTEVAVKGLDLEERALDLTLEVKKEQVEIAKISFALTTPSAPISGKLERIIARKGSQVSPGMPLFTVANSKKRAFLEVLVNGHTKDLIDTKVNAQVGEAGVEAKFSFASSVPVVGDLYSVIYELPGEVTLGLQEVRIPLKVIAGDIVLVPIDAVHQTAVGATVFVLDRDVARAVDVDLGDVVGGMVEVIKSQVAGKTIILDRAVLDGQKVSI